MKFSLHKCIMMGLVLFMVYHSSQKVPQIADIASRAAESPVYSAVVSTVFTTPAASQETSESAIAALDHEQTEYRNDGPELEIMFQRKPTVTGGGDGGVIQQQQQQQEAAQEHEDPNEYPDMGPHQPASSEQDSSSSPFPKFLRDYVKFHNEHKDQPGTKYLIWRCPLNSNCGGAGDRLKGILSALYTAICTQRVLLIHWPLSDGSDVTRFLKSHNVNWEISPKLRPQWSPNAQVYSVMDNYQNQWLVNLAVPTTYESVPFIDMRCNLWSDWEKGVVKTNSTQCIQELWRAEPPQIMHPHYEQDDYLFRYGFWTLFTFSNIVHERKRAMQQQAELIMPGVMKDNQQQRRLHHQIRGSNNNNLHLVVKDAQNSSLQNPSNSYIIAKQQRQLRSSNTEDEESIIAGDTRIQPYIAIHIRTGIGSTWNDPVRHGTNEDYQSFYQCAKKLQQGILDRQRQASSQCPTSSVEEEPSLKMPIYVAADNVAAKQALKQMDASAPEQTIRTIDNMEIYHIDRSATSSSTTAESELTVWAELNVLLESTCIIASRSGFSDLAKWLQPFQKRRCAVQFNMCDDDALVQRALNNLEFPCRNT